MMDLPHNQKGRSAAGDPPNRFLAIQRVVDPDAELDAEDEPSRQRVTTQFLPDRSESIVTENDSPDVPLRYSVNPYRGCEHGCSYCYARRPTHEYLGLGAGLDFESKIFVKERAPELFGSWLAARRLGARDDLLLRHHGLLSARRAELPAHPPVSASRRRGAGNRLESSPKNRLVTGISTCLRRWPSSRSCMFRSASRRSTKSSLAAWSRERAGLLPQARGHSQVGTCRRADAGDDRAGHSGA